MSIIQYTQCPESTLKKKSNEICYMQFTIQLQWVKAELVMLRLLKIQPILQPK